MLLCCRFPKVSAADKGTETDTNQNQQLCYHVVGQPQSQDVVVLADPEHPVSLVPSSLACTTGQDTQGQALTPVCQL